MHCSVLHVCAQLHILQHLTTHTSGAFHHIALDADHFQSLLARLVSPPIADKLAKAALLQMGFPQRLISNTPSLCVW